MSDTGFSQESFEFLQNLAANNTSEWFQANRKAYETHLRKPFIALLEGLTLRLADAPVPLIGTAKTMFRINRDVRFSKDKTPYNTQVSGVLTASGAKSQNSGVVYLMIGQGGGMMAAGWHNLKAGDLAPFREAMVADAKSFSDMKEALKDNGLALETSNSLARMPRGFEYAEDHEHAEAIRLKSLLIQQDLKRADWTSDRIIGEAENFARAAMPLLTWGRAALGR